jgi:hypothetical protein
VGLSTINPGEAAAVARVQGFRLAPQLVEPAKSARGAEYQRTLDRAIGADVGRLFRYCRFAELDAALALGWLLSDANLHQPHLSYAVLVEWLCSCPPRWPA